MTARETSFGESRPPTVVDRFGVWLSKRQIQRTVGRLDGRDVADFGCGHQAKTMRHRIKSAPLGREHIGVGFRAIWKMTLQYPLGATCFT